MSTPVRTRIWLEEPESDGTGTRAAYCHGYDVYGDMLGQSRWVDMLYLLLRGEAPDARDADLLEALAVAVANAGPRHAAVHAAMCAGVGGSTAASALIAALAVGAGQQGGAREVFLAMQDWRHCGTDLQSWRERFARSPEAIASIWPGCNHPPGFDPGSARTATIVKQALHRMATLSSGPRLCWMAEHLNALQALGGMGVTMEGVAAAALCDLGFTPEQGEMLHLLLRLPGAAAHALEQAALGHKNFPFFQVELEDDPRTKDAAA
jgi:citrate synthase